MATKRGKELQAKALARRATKKTKRFSKRWDARVEYMKADMLLIAALKAAQQAPVVA